eukprot:scaffold4985_cov188-Prasinococcus_capsulatus_cf.AAC.2
MCCDDPSAVRGGSDVVGEAAAEAEMRGGGEGSAAAAAAAANTPQDREPCLMLPLPTTTMLLDGAPPACHASSASGRAGQGRARAAGRAPRGAMEWCC